MKTIELDIVFLSYDEPNADLHYADLCSKASSIIFWVIPSSCIFSYQLSVISYQLSVISQQ